MTFAERMMNAQKEALKSLNNYKFTQDGYEYRLVYNGGVAEFVSIYGRRVGTEAYKYISGFEGYDLYSREDAIAEAKKIISKS